MKNLSIRALSHSFDWPTNYIAKPLEAWVLVKYPLHSGKFFNFPRNSEYQFFTSN